MAIDPVYFKDYPDLKKGDFVYFKRQTRSREGTGIVRLIWLGIEEMCDVVTVDNENITLCRAIGDTVTKRASGE